jgi:hypothetical protein
MTVKAEKFDFEQRGKKFQSLNHRVSVMNPVYNPPETEEFRQLCINGRGVLLQTEHIQVGLITDTTTPQAVFTFYYGNITEDGSVSNMDISLDNPDRNSLGLEVTDASPQFLGPLQQVPHVVKFSCHREYIGVPLLRIKYNYNGQDFVASAHLPLCVTTFSKPLEFSPQEFLASWGDVNGRCLLKEPSSNFRGI